MNSRICIRCNSEKLLKEFGWHDKSKGRRRTVCRVCRNIDANNWRKKEKTDINERCRKLYNNKKDYFIEKFGNKCNSCNLSYPSCVYDFHHIDPSKKDRNYGQLFNMSWQKIEKELSKCVLLCANCHRLEHMKMRGGS